MQPPETAHNARQHLALSGGPPFSSSSNAEAMSSSSVVDGPPPSAPARPSGPSGSDWMERQATGKTPMRLQAAG